MTRAPNDISVTALRPQNREEASCVSICFHDPEIANLFANLLAARGIANSICNTLENTITGTRVITEADLFEDLPDPANHPCLLVGQCKFPLPPTVIALPQPLTEGKIEAA
ncbi:MAG: hypothetical protein K1X79_14245, partial [Oligoflexia bacterium]|nr:hypothetical protein [Oligoflexia bacterium]